MIKILFPEGATPLEDLSGLKFSWVRTLSDLNRVEAENISRAQKKYLEKKIDHPLEWFHPTFFRKVHSAMFGEVWTWAGSWRKSITNIGIKPQLIPMRLSELCSQVISWDSESLYESCLERSAPGRLHDKFLDFSATSAFSASLR